MKQILSELTPAGLRALSNGDALAIRVPRFLPESDCSRIAETVLRSRHFRYPGKGFLSLGPGGFELPDAAKDYFGTAGDIDEVLTRPYAALEAALGQLTRPLYTIDKRMRPLTARRYTPDFVAPPHQDHDEAEWATSQLGISLGLIGPPSGGAIRLWDLAYSPADYADRKLPGRFELDESKIPPHDAKLAGGVGELLVIDARRIHAIDEIIAGVRISVSGFLAVDGPRFWIWS